MKRAVSSFVPIRPNVSRFGIFESVHDGTGLDGESLLDKKLSKSNANADIDEGTDS